MPSRRSNSTQEATPRRPFIHLNCALCPDGRMGTDDGKALAISCTDDWQRVHGLRESYDGVAVGAKTWLGDHPRLTARREVLGREPIRQPARVIFAGGWLCKVERDPRRTFLIGQRSPSLPHAVHLYIRDRRLPDVLETLHDHGVRSLLVEGGPTLLRSFLGQGAFDQLSFYVATEDSESARLAVKRVFPELPGLSCQRFGDGTLLGYQRTRPRDASTTALDKSLQLLRAKLTYLDVPANGSERLVLMGPVPLPILLAEEPRDFHWYVFGSASAAGTGHAGGPVNSALVYGDIETADVPLVRIHSGCQTGDVFASMRCDCGAQLEKSLGEIVDAGAGVAIYVAEHEGRGIGLWAKAMAYLLQDQGRDTYEANRDLGYPEDARSYDKAAAVLGRLLPHRRIRLLSNNPAKRAALESFGFAVVEMRSLMAGHNPMNRRYLEAKARNGHLMVPSGMSELGGED